VEALPGGRGSRADGGGRRQHVVHVHAAAVETWPPAPGDGLLQQHLQTAARLRARRLVQVVPPRRRTHTLYKNVFTITKTALYKSAAYN
jgi:hypothetical protein